MKIDQSNTPLNLASDVAEIMKTLRITPHGVTKVSPFEANMGRKPNTPFSNIATRSSPNNLNWESAKHACLDRKNFTKPPLPAKVMQDLHAGRRTKCQLKNRNRKLNNNYRGLFKTATRNKTQWQILIELAKNKLNVRYKGIQRTTDKNTKKRKDEVAQKLKLAAKTQDFKKIQLKKNHTRKISHIWTTHHMGTNFWKTAEAVKK